MSYPTGVTRISYVGHHERFLYILWPNQHHFVINPNPNCPSPPYQGIILEQEVLGLEVSMCNVQRMTVLQGQRYLEGRHKVSSGSSC